MENNNNEQFDWVKEVMPETVKRIQRDHQRKIEIDERLEHCHLVTRMQQGIAVGVASAIAITGLCFYLGGKFGPKGPKPTETTITTTVEDDNIYLYRNYTVEFGDSLSYLSQISGISISTIREANGMGPKDTMIIDGQKLKLYYPVKPEDLKYYTAIVELDGRDIFDIAKEYETDVDTLCKLNKDSIVETYDSEKQVYRYSIKGNTLIVPNFITPRELEEVKGYSK